MGVSLSFLKSHNIIHKIIKEVQMKTAIIYYSYEGNCSLVSKIIKDTLNADIFEIKTVDDKIRTGLAKYLWGGSQVVFHKKPALRPLSVDINAYDLIILGCPVWAGSPAPAIISFLSGTKIAGKKIALFCCHAGGKKKAFDKFRALLNGNSIAGEIDFVNPAGKSPEKLKLIIGDWVKTISA